MGDYAYPILIQIQKACTAIVIWGANQNVYDENMKK